MLILSAIALLFLVYYYPSQNAMKLLHYDKLHSKSKEDKLTIGEILSCCFPLWQCVVTRRTLRKTAGAVKPLAIIATILILAGAGLEIFAKTNIQLTVIGLVMLLLGILLHQLVYTITYFDIAIIFNFGMVYKVLALLIPEFVAYFCVTAVPRALAELDKRLQVKYSAN